MTSTLSTPQSGFGWMSFALLSVVTINRSFAPVTTSDHHDINLRLCLRTGQWSTPYAMSGGQAIAHRPACRPDLTLRYERSVLGVWWTICPPRAGSSQTHWWERTADRSGDRSAPGCAPRAFDGPGSSNPPRHEIMESRGHWLRWHHPARRWCLLERPISEVDSRPDIIVG